MSLVVIINLIFSFAVVAAVVGSLAWSVISDNGFYLASPIRSGRRPSFNTEPIPVTA